MIINIYHGSESIVFPQYGKGKLYNDYGRGFYCTENLEMAKEWACSHGKDGYVNCFELTIDDLSILDLNDGQYNILNWLAILMDNRKFATKGTIAKAGLEYVLDNFLPRYHDYDIIKGYRADDSYFSFAGDFVSNSLSLKDLKIAMSLGTLGEQIVLMSQKAFDAISCTSPIPVSANDYYKKYRNRDTEARNKYKELSIKDIDAGELYILDIIRENIKDGDPRI